MYFRKRFQQHTLSRTVCAEVSLRDYSLCHRLRFSRSRTLGIRSSCAIENKRTGGNPELVGMSEKLRKPFGRNLIRQVHGLCLASVLIWSSNQEIGRVVVISVWTTTVFVMTVESDYSVKSGALRPQQKIIIIITKLVYHRKRVLAARGATPRQDSEI